MNITEQKLDVRIRVTGKKDTFVSSIVLSTFPVLWEGWECDSVGYIVLHDNKKKLVLRDHGTPYFANLGSLKARIQFYKTVIKKTEDALAILEEALPVRTVK